MEATKVTVEELDGLVQKMVEARKVCDEKQALLTEANKALAEIEQTFTKCLKELGRHNYKTPIGTVSLIEKWNYKMPADASDKKRFFEFLKEKGVFDHYATVNYQSLNSFCRQEREIAEQEGRALEFTIPGVGEPTLYETITFRKG